MEIITRMSAAKAGLKRYHTGKQCKRGHDSERWVYNGHCVECTMESKRGDSSDDDVPHWNSPEGWKDFL